MSALEFEPWPKIPRLRRGMLVTEKIDGTNAAVVIIDRLELDTIEHADGSWYLSEPDDSRALATVEGEDGHEFVVFAQSRTRFITPTADNYGFAGYVQRNAKALVTALGPGRHFGEWWGSGIQRGYGLTGGDKRFSLFNARRWRDADLSGVPGLGVVPTLYEGPFGDLHVEDALDRLALGGSFAAPSFDRPEGVVVWHDAARSSFKVLLEGDDVPKGAAA